MVVILVVNQWFFAATKHVIIAISFIEWAVYVSVVVDVDVAVAVDVAIAIDIAIVISIQISIAIMIPIMFFFHCVIQQV